MDEGKKLLYVEDNPYDRMLVRKIMEAEGYNIREALDGISAIQMVKKEKPALILMDLDIPGLDGYATVTKLRLLEESSQTPIVALTAMIKKGTREEALVAGCDGYIQKPIDVDIFPKQIKRFLEGMQEKVPKEEVNIYLKHYNVNLIEKLEAKIKELEEANRRVSESKALLQTVIDGIPDKISIRDQDYRIVAANLATVKAYNKAFQEVIGEKCYKIFKEIDKPCELCAVREAIKTKKTIVLKKTYDYLSNIVNQYAYPIINQDGKVVSVILYTQDITETELLTQKLIQSERLAAMGEMSASIAHELNNYLSGIFMRVQLLPDYIKANPEKALYHVNLMEEYLNKIAKFVTGLMDYCRVETRKGECNINGIIQNAIEFLKPHNKYDNIEFLLSLDKDLPSVFADPQQMEQVLVNLFNNAAEAMGRGKIKVETRTGEGFIEISVIDEGPGIPEEIRGRIFEPHFSTKEKGFGFGLATCYRIITNHGGTIQAEGDAGKGAHFRVLLPLNRT